eukprot:TRINITY_DN436_c0_g1_i3.p1 TRINITY_DN436_c0_g1~~TRINITY_DN436_c0_g1_i3.p1  ORF type:complete len:277 (+),score=53.17 TRINITY_DN436_c0_g1_i3:260-1090(+)
MEQQESVDEAKRKEDLQGWLAEIHQRRNTIIQRKARLEEQRAQVNNRRSELSKKRMRLLASAAAEGDIEESFGANDEDWQVYKEMSKEVESDSEDDERLEKLTTLLIKYDPKFASSETGATNADDPDAYYQVSLSSERVRFPEVIFQPSIIGVDNAGPLEIMQSILQKYDRETQLSLAKNVFLTGGNTMYKGIVDRFTNDIRSIRPVNSTIRVTRAADPYLDAWRGFAAFVRGELVRYPNYRQAFITRAVYEENGSHYLAEHPFSNQYYAPIPQDP